MNQLHIIYHIARADFYERVRRYSFLVMLMLAIFLGYQVAIGNMSLQLGQYRGEFNSAWVGALMSLIATFFIGWFGFYLVKGAVENDRRTGVGQIIAATLVNRPQYAIGKWISNFLVLMSMVGILALAGLVIQFLQGESSSVNLFAFLSPFIFVAAPLIAIVAAAAVLFETIPFLAGGFGNIAYFFAFIISLPLFLENEMLKQYPAFEPMGLGVISSEMGRALQAVFPDYDGSFTLGSTDETVTDVFTWNGIEWTAEIFFARFVVFAFSIGMILLAALFFDRFDSSRRKPKPTKTRAALSPLEVDSAPRAIAAPHLTPLRADGQRFSFINVLFGELKLLLKGQRWWWYLVAAGLGVACFSGDMETVRKIILPMAWLWHILIISPLGNREARDNVQQLAFSSASPLWRQLPAQWLAGFIVTALLGSGAALNFLLHGETAALGFFFISAAFIPSLALALGVWSGTSKTFEVIYLLLWYVGPMNSVPPVDYIYTGNPSAFLLAAVLLLAAAFTGRARQLRN